MPIIQRIRFRQGEQKHFDFFCVAPSESQAFQKLNNWMNQHPGNYRSFSGGFSLSPEDLPKEIALAGLGLGAVVEA
jgi:hypothetical protein